MFCWSGAGTAARKDDEDIGVAEVKKDEGFCSETEGYLCGVEQCEVDGTHFAQQPLEPALSTEASCLKINVCEAKILDCMFRNVSTSSTYFSSRSTRSVKSLTSILSRRGFEVVWAFAGDGVNDANDLFCSGDTVGIHVISQGDNMHT